MARRVKKVVIDDLDASTAHETVSFSLDHVTWDIDLSREHSTELRAALRPYIEHARPAEPTDDDVATRMLAAARAWAAAQSYQIDPDQRLPVQVLREYLQTQRPPDTLFGADPRHNGDGGVTSTPEPSAPEPSTADG